MKRLLFASVIAVGLVAAVVAGSAVGAGSAAPVKYRVSYMDPVFGKTSCAGVHLTGKNGTSVSGGEDVFFCTIGRHRTPGTVYTQASGPWCSDYFMQAAVLGSCVEASTYTMTVGGSGQSLVGKAFYP
jgi:hypothetical protein